MKRSQLVNSSNFIIFSTLAVIILLASIGGYTLIENALQEEKLIDSENNFSTFSACQEIERYIADGNENYYYPYFDGFAVEESLEFDTGAAPSTNLGLGSGGEIRDFSTTNVQVEGIDEADIIKTDGNYIYVAWGDQISIIEVVSEAEQKIVNQFKVPGDPFDLFLEKDTLVVLSRDSGYYDYVAYDNYWPLQESETGAFIYNISSRESEELEREVKIEGDFVTARFRDGIVYMVSSKYFNSDQGANNIEEVIVQLQDTQISEEYQAIADCDEISYYGDSVNSFVSVTAIPIDGSESNSRLILGDAQNIYMSHQNLYLATLDREYEECEEREPRRRPVEPRPFWDLSEEEVTSEILLEPPGCYRRILDTNTEVYKLAIDQTDIAFAAKGVVNGTILNQFSMDEYGRNFRIATTANDNEGWNRDSYNNLYILDEDLNEIGSVENLARGEQIYSVRYIGPRAYMVTFKTIDPLFVLDLSNPEDPEVLGELKIPGYSDYLHPFDDNHLIGIGKEAVELNSNTALQQGVKVALFDVSDVTNPIEKSTIEIGDRGTDSAVSYDHKAFLFDRERELLVLPIDLNEISVKDENFDSWQYGDRTFSGFYVLNVNEDGITERGRIGEEINQEEYFYGLSQDPRSLYIDNNLFTLNNGVLRVNNLETLEPVNELRVGGEVGNFWRF